MSPGGVWGCDANHVRLLTKRGSITGNNQAAPLGSLVETKIENYSNCISLYNYLRTVAYPATSPKLMAPTEEELEKVSKTVGDMMKMFKSS